VTGNEITGAIEYKVYRNGQYVGSMYNFEFIDTNLAPQTTYSYMVEAVDADGQVITSSNLVTVATL